VRRDPFPLPSRPTSGGLFGRLGQHDLTFPLACFSLALGAAQVAAPGPFARAIGLHAGPRDRLLTRVVGAREVATGIALLVLRRPALLWARVAGDAMDLALLGAAFRSDGTGKPRLVAALASVAGVLLPDALGAAGRRGPAAGPVAAYVTVGQPPLETYRAWRDSESHHRLIAGATVVDDRPGERIGWRASPGDGSPGAADGSITFALAPAGRGTEVRLFLSDPPGGSDAVHPQDHLRAFKQRLETGLIPHSEATIHGHPHPARPTTDKALERLAA
jgi:uncharacterized membrane protein